MKRATASFLFDIYHKSSEQKKWLSLINFCKHWRQNVFYCVCSLRLFINAILIKEGNSPFPSFTAGPSKTQHVLGGILGKDLKAGSFTGEDKFYRYVRNEIMTLAGTRYGNRYKDRNLTVYNGPWDDIIVAIRLSLLALMINGMPTSWTW